jgi:hypothetical protein
MLMLAHTHACVYIFIVIYTRIHTHIYTNSALRLIYNKWGRILRRTRWRMRRKQYIYLWRFMTLAKNVHHMRVCLLKNSYRSKIIKVQHWWRKKLQSHDSPSLLIELKWKQREAVRERVYCVCVCVCVYRESVNTCCILQTCKRILT